jgi:CMP-N-acetylneuraminic acid synthetase
MRPRIAALIPMRHHSERVPEKNYRPFAGRPLYHHIVLSLLQCPAVDKVIIDTDSPFIMDDASRHFPQIQLLERPEHLIADTISMNDVLLNSVTQVAADYYLQTHSTNPLLRSETISRAVRAFLDAFPAHDSLFSVTRIQSRMWDSSGAAVNHDPSVLLRTQELQPLYEENSCLYIFTRSTLENRRNRLGEHPLMFEIDRLEAWDIDEESDFRIAELLYLGLQNNPRGTEL